MKFKTLSCGVAALAGSLFGAAVCDVLPESAQTEFKAQAENKQTGELTLEEIAAEMAKKDCNAILSSQSNIEYVTYDAKKKVTDFDELVYQAQLPLAKRKPVVVLWYVNQNANRSKRSSIVFKQWSKVHKQTLKFVAYEANTDPALAKNNYDGLLKKHDVKSIPSFSLYHTEDYTTKKDETAVTKLDTWQGGSGKNSKINTWIKIGNKHWLSTNVTKPNKKFVIRGKNTLPNKWFKIDYNSK